MSAQRVITVKGMAGIGNRLFTVAHAMRLAARKSARIEVDWSDGQIGPIGVDLFSDYFESSRNVRGIVSEWRIHSSDSDYTMSKPMTLILQPLLRAGIVESAEVWVSKNRKPRIIFPLELEFLFCKNSPICATHLPVQEHVDELLSIQIKGEVTKRFDRMLPTDLGNRVGVHVRYSDKRPEQDFQKLIQKVKNEKVLLATDSKEVQQTFLNECLDCVVLSTILHDGNSKKGLHHQEFDHAKKLHVFEESLLDLYALSRAGTFLGQFNSSFSRIVGIWREGQGVQFWS